ncbi:hypothetical protein Leryth_011944 [Lithospermum erythrorhizon]|nr:hypothetical protein Leryth_011944 [Lithospermum erythrorhizon]
MSRCFPFPPPGYEKKLRPEEDLLREEKRREKKHKKEKKSKRKREGDSKEERGNKDRDKQKEKKEKKDKHRDKKEKEKTKSKDKDESSISDDATTAGQPEPSGKDNTRPREECSNAKSHGFSEKKFPTAFQGQNGWSLTDNRLVKENEESKFVQELGRRIKDEGNAIGSRTVQRSASSDRRGYEEMHRSAVTDLQISAKYMECKWGHEVDPKRVEGKGLKDGHHLNGNNTIQNLTGSINRKVETPHEPVQRGIEKTVPEKDTSNGKSDDKRGKKRKDRDKKEKKSHGKDKERDKEKKKEKVEEKKKEEKEKEMTEYKKTDQDRSKDLYRNEHASSSKNINGYSSLVDNNFFSTENVKTKKDVEANGFCHENEIGSNKLRTHQLMNNGKILDACRSPGLLDSNRLCIPLQDKVGVKYHELNGTVGSQSSSMPKQKPPLVPTARSDQPIKAADKVVEASRKLPQIVEASTEGLLAGKVIETSRRALEASRNAEPSKKHSRADRITEPSKKPPHPDLKYLTEVLSVPKMEEWSGIDDQDWLFNNKDLLLEKQKPDVTVDSRQPQVWSETLHIESADVYALPYVIPY